MKKIILSVTLAVMLFGNTAYAQVVPAVDYQQLQQQYQSLILQLIELLNLKIAELQAQLAKLQPVEQVSTPLPEVSAPILTPVEPIVLPSAPVEATSTAPSVPAPYKPEIVLTLNGDQLSWKIEGGREDFLCKLNNVDVSQNGSIVLLNPSSPNINLECTGSRTAIRVRKSL